MDSATCDLRANGRPELPMQLVEAGLLVSSGERGVYGKGGVFETLVKHFQRPSTRPGSDQAAEVASSSPLLSQKAHEGADHVESMPHLLGAILGFHGNERSHSGLISRAQSGEDWKGGLFVTDVMPVLEACDPLYPSTTGSLPEAGIEVGLGASVFRSVPLGDTARMN